MAKKGSAITKPQKISPALASVIGKGPLSRGQVMKKIWAYIKKQKGMQEGRNIHLNAELKELFGTRKKVISMFELAKLISPHIGDGASSSKKAPKKKSNPEYEYEDDDHDEGDYCDDDDDDDVYDAEDYYDEDDEYDDDDYE